MCDEFDRALVLFGVDGRIRRPGLPSAQDSSAAARPWPSTELRWPTGGAVLFGSTKHTDSVHGGMRPGTSAMNIPTQEVDEIHQRAAAASAEVIQPPNNTRFGSGTSAYAFTIRDPGGYLWTFGTYVGAP